MSSSNIIMNVSRCFCVFLFLRILAFYSILFPPYYDQKHITESYYILWPYRKAFQLEHFYEVCVFKTSDQQPFFSPLLFFTNVHLQISIHIHNKRTARSGAVL